ncbi:MAG: threonylcarbamoyl-AMP synthase [Betaproteobacteria bacterium]|nr:threonylcarbamoyl-AMP synthase [Betaproteobacteria bacterium]
MILPGSDPAAIEAAAQALARGELIGLPTETVYGLGADADNPQAVARVFAAKGRPNDHPLIVHVTDASQAAHYADPIPPVAQRLMAAHWPGPLTLILPRRAGVAEASAGGQDSIGLRCPSHPVAQAVMRRAQALGVQGISAPSANHFGRVSPTTAAHVQDELGSELLVLDGGACEVGIESTIIDCTRGRPVLLRPGMLSIETLSAAAGEPVLSPQAFAQLHPAPAAAPRASGTLESHYAPRARVHLLSHAALQARLDALAPEAQHPPSRPACGVWARTALRVPHGAVLRAMPERASECAHVLFAELRAFDQLGVSDILVETPPSSTDWDGVRDRLTRAAA